MLEEIQAALDAGVSMDSLANRLLPKRERSYRAWVYSIAALLTIVLSVFAYYYFKDNSQPINFENMSLRKLSQTNKVTYAQITPDGKSVVYFTLEENSTRSIWIRRVEDRNALRLVSNEPQQFWGGIGISPDASQIFYSVADENARFGTLYRISSLGGTPRKLIEKANDVGSVSSDGQRILFVRRNSDRLQIITANTADGGEERIVHTGQPDELFRDPKFSADDKSVFYSKRKTNNGKSLWSLVEIPVEGGVERTILDTNGERIGELAVLKNGQGILINKGDDASILQQLFHVSIADGKEKRLTNDLNSYHGISVSDDGNSIAATQNFTTKDIWIVKNGENPRKITTESNVYSNACFMPDGRIVYDATDNNRPQIWIMNADGSNPQQLTPYDSFNFEPQISPDGRYIIFTSDRTGESEIWRMNTDGSNSIILTNTIGPSFAPIVSSDSTVWFQWNKENKQILAKIPVSGGEITIPEPNFGDHQWAISPDGKSVALVFFDEENKRFKLRIRPINTEEPSKIFDIAATNVLAWTADGENLLYRSLEPSPETLSAIWEQPLSGGKPKQFLSVKPDRVSKITQSADGKQTLFIRTKTSTDAVLLTKTKE